MDLVFMSRVKDECFPGLNAALDPNAVLEMLRREMQLKVGLEIADVSISEIHHRTGSAFCTLAYLIKIRDSKTGRARNERILVSVLPKGEGPQMPSQSSIDKFARLDNLPFRTPAAYLPPEGLVFYSPYADPSFPWLVDAVSPALMKKELDQTWSDEGTTVRQVSAQLLKYAPVLPRTRAVLLYDVDVVPEKGGSGQHRRVIGKLDPRQDPSQMFRRSLALWKAGRERDVNFSHPVGYIGPLWLSLQEYIPGQSLRHLFGSPGFEDLIRQAARSIAAIHTAKIPLSNYQFRRCRTRGSKLSAIRPDLAPHFEQLGRDLTSEIERRMVISGLTHGDFHLGNVLADEGGVTLIDLDGLAYGDPMLDLGFFLASMSRIALRPGGDIPAFEITRQAFLEEYSKLAPVDANRINLFEAYCLISVVAPLARLANATESRGQKTEVTLDYASNLLSLSTKRQFSVSSYQEPKVFNSEVEQLAKAKSLPYLKMKLTEPIRTAYQAELTDIQVSNAQITNLGPLLQYEVAGEKDHSPWSARLEGVAIRSDASVNRNTSPPIPLLQTIWDNGSNNSEDFLLPRPIAHITPLMMTLFERLPEGKAFGRIIRSPASLERVAKVASALAGLHQIPVEWEQTRSLEAEILLTRVRVDSLKQHSWRLGHRASQLLFQAEERLRDLPERLGPCLGTLHPRWISLVGERIAFTRLETLSITNPLIDVGDLVSEITISGLANHRVATIADSIREAYLDASEGVSVAEIAVFEALALLRKVLIQVNKPIPALSPEEVIGAAATRLEGIR
ncbi:MAG: phosphotransferase [Dehalococcoidia bacterium]